MNIMKNVSVAGFTLVEMMVVVMVLGILATLAAPSFQSLMQSQQVRNASFELYSSLRLARSEAIKRNGNVTVTPVNSDDWGLGWTITSAEGVPLKSQASLKGVSITGMPGSVVYARSGRVNVAASFQIAASSSNMRCLSILLGGMPHSSTGACS